MAPSQLQAFIQTVRERFDEISGGVVPVLLTSPFVRPYVRSIIERFRPLTPVSLRTRFTRQCASARWGRSGPMQPHLLHPMDGTRLRP
jgi:hypothetical protein